MISKFMEEATQVQRMLVQSARHHARVTWTAAMMACVVPVSEARAEEILSAFAALGGPTERLSLLKTESGYLLSRPRSR